MQSARTERIHVTIQTIPYAAIAEAIKNSTRIMANSVGDEHVAAQV
jgi:hypothetical protein